jgi:hypothetical protein
VRTAWTSELSGACIQYMTAARSAPTTMPASTRGRNRPALAPIRSAIDAEHLGE